MQQQQKQIKNGCQMESDKEKKFSIYIYTWTERIYKYLLALSNGMETCFEINVTNKF